MEKRYLLTEEEYGEFVDMQKWKNTRENLSILTFKYLKDTGNLPCINMGLISERKFCDRCPLKGVCVMDKKFSRDGTTHYG